MRCHKLESASAPAKHRAPPTGIDSLTTCLVMRRPSGVLERKKDLPPLSNVGGYCKRIRPITILLCILCGLACWLIIGVSFMTWQIFPEIGMVVHSQCANPVRGWDGKFLSFRVWKSSFDSISPESNVHYKGATSDRRLLSSLDNRFLRSRSSDKRPIVLWGSHHKTGTYLAQKIFSRLCDRMGWCCIFQATRDSIHSIQEVLSSESNLNVLGHSQWIWHPKELVGDQPYYFVHFYRQPFKKIISGVRYHMSGAEGWTTRPLHYPRACDYKDIMRAGNTSAVATDTGIDGSRRRVSRQAVVHYCESVHLCETCCRREHELEMMHQTSSAQAQADISENSGPGEAAQRNHVIRSYESRSNREYDFICKSLGSLHNTSLQGALLTLPSSRAVAVEAGLDYFENLRMAHLFNATYHDPRSLNIDLDDLMRNYEGVIRQILTHLQLGVTAAALESLVEDLKFYDINSSPIYRWSMSTSLFNHIDNHREANPIDYLSLIKADDDVMNVYKPIIELMSESYNKRKQ